MQQNIALFALNAATWTDIENSKEKYEEVGPTAERLEEDNMEEATLSPKHRVDLELLHGTWPATKLKRQGKKARWALRKVKQNHYIKY